MRWRLLSLPGSPFRRFISPKHIKASAYGLNNGQLPDRLFAEIRIFTISVMAQTDLQSHTSRASANTSRARRTIRFMAASDLSEE
jgi:hypothetical protein